jgi:hypothetical protein
MLGAPVSGGAVKGSCAAVAMEIKKTQNVDTRRQSEVLIS